MKQQYMILSVIVIILIISIVSFFIWSKIKNQRHQITTSTENILTANKIKNDKLVIVNDITEKEITKIIQDFRDFYHNQPYQFVPRLIKLTNKKFAIIFPYDINFKIYCFFINYVNYPKEFTKTFKTVGWVTTKLTDEWITENSANKSVMLFVSDFDTEYDNVFLTTSDNIGYKFGFARAEEKQLLNNPEKKYVKPPMTINELKSKEYTEFK